MESGKFYVTFVMLLMLGVSTCAQNFRRDGQHGVNYANFAKNPSQRLNAAVMASLMTSRSQECTYQCINHQKCYSVNFAAATHSCELLNTDKFEHSTSGLVSSNSFDHYNIKVSIKLFVLTKEYQFPRQFLLFRVIY